MPRRSQPPERRDKILFNSGLDDDSRARAESVPVRIAAVDPHLLLPLALAPLAAPRRRWLIFIVLGAALAMIANMPWLTQRLPQLAWIDGSWLAVLRSPAAVMVMNVAAGLMVLFGLVRLATVRDPTLRLARRLERHGDAVGAAAMYAQAGDKHRALALFRTGRAWREAAQSALELGLESEAAGLLRKAGGHHLTEAARLYRRIGEAETAQRCDHELAEWLANRGRLDEAIEAWLRAGEPLRAARTAHVALAERRLQPSHSAYHAAWRAAAATRDHTLLALLCELSGQWLKAAQAWRAAGESSRAAENFRRAGNLEEAAREKTAAGRPLESIQLRMQHLVQMRERLGGITGGADGSTVEARRLQLAIAQESSALVTALDELGMVDEVVEVLCIADRIEEAVERRTAGGRPEAAAELARESQRWDLAAPLLERLHRWAEAADSYELGGDLASAARCAEQAGEDERALVMYRSLGRTDAAARCLAHVGRLEDGLVELHREGLLDQALQLLHAHPGPVPDIPDVVLDMAEHAYRHGDRSQAVACLRRAVLGVALRPGRLEPAVALARLLFEGGEVDTALAQLQRVLEIDYSNEPARDLHQEALAAQTSSAPADTQATRVTGAAPSLPSRPEERYAILNELGRGGMGVVYRALDARLERDVAIKVLRTTSPEEAARLEQEAKAAATLNHSGIVTVFDFEAGFGGYFIVMEHVPGEALDRLLRTDPQRIARNLGAILFRLADAVAYAHQHDVIHRDLKPGNVLLTPDGKVKVLDFGIAARLDREAGIAPGVCGTPFYMAPEQIRGEAPTPASDVYAFGATAFHLSTGRPPFPRGNVIEAHLSQLPPDPMELAPGLDPELASLILRCLAKDPSARFANASALRDALRPFALRNLSGPAHRIDPSRPPA